MMSLDWISVARPYAKAVFETAVDNNALKSYSDTLKNLAEIAILPEIQFCMKTPEVTSAQMVEIFSQAAGLSTGPLQSFVKIVVNVGRLGALPAIYTLYEKYRADYEKTIEAYVDTFAPLTEKQQVALTLSLKKRFNREVTLQMHIDESLLGGAVVRVGDFVVDGSVRGKLHRLNDEMMK